MLLYSIGKMKIVFLFVAFISATLVKAQTTFPDCDILMGGVSVPSVVSLNIDDDQRGNILDLTTDKVDSSELEEGTNSKYYELAFDGAANTLKLSLSAAYDDMEQNVESSSGNTKLTVRITVICNGVKNTLFVEPIVIDKNNHPTELPLGPVSYNIPLPLPTKVPLDLFKTGESLIARDADISNHIITFEMEPSDIFAISGEVDPTDILKKRYIATITAIKPISKLDVDSFKVTAKDRDNNPVTKDITITVDVASSIPSPPKFTKDHYIGTYSITDEHSLNIEELLLENVKSQAISTDLEGDIGDSFQIAYDEEKSTITLTKKTDLPQTILDTNIYLTLTVKVTNTGFELPTTSVTVLINLPKKFPFPEALYLAEYTDTNEVTLLSPIEVTIPDLVVEIAESDFKKYFSIDFNTPPDVLINVQTALPEDVLKENEFITLVLIALGRDSNVEYGETGLVIQLPEKVTEPSGNIFSKAVYIGDYVVPDDDGEHTVDIEDMSVIPDGITISITGEYADNFHVVLGVDKKIMLSITTDLTEHEWNANTIISLLLQGTDGAELNGGARIILTLPQTDCDVPNPDVTITFDDIYYKINPDHEGDIGTFTATFDPPEEFTFEISNQPSWVKLNGAILSLQENIQLQPGTYSMKATVSGTSPGAIKSAQVTIYVSSTAAPGRTQNSLTVVELDEETIVTDLLNLDDVLAEGESKIYEYVIKQQVPPTDIPLFKIETTADGRFLTSVKIDREDPLFAQLRTPQVVLTLSLEEKLFATNIKAMLATHPLFKYTPKYQKRNSQEFKECLMLDKTIIREDRIMYVPVIIKDINDHAPEFPAPAITVGYPTKDIVFDINPPYLFKLEATDDDEGENAVIIYSSESTAIKIKSETAMVYPTEGLYSATGEVTLTITASNKNDVNKVDLAVKVLPLDKDHISVLVFANVLLDDLETTLAALSAGIDVKIYSLRAGSLPLQSAPTTRADTDLYLKAVVYAIDNAGAALTHESLAAKLVGQPDVTIIKYTPGGSGTGGDQDPEECDDTGLIAGIAVLAAALVLCIAGFVVFYLKKKNNNASLDLEQLPDHKTSFKKSNASQNGFDSNVVLKDVATRRPTQYPMEAPKVEEDNSSDSSSSSEDGEDFDEARERRKSVTFNEKTEHFDITAKENETDAAKAADTGNKES